jgi:hypothetical protein
VGSSVTDAITDALTEFDILWTEIACEDDDALYTDAKALKADLLSHAVGRNRKDGKEDLSHIQRQQIIR